MTHFRCADRHASACPVSIVQDTNMHSTLVYTTAASTLAQKTSSVIEPKAVLAAEVALEI